VHKTAGYLLVDFHSSCGGTFIQIAIIANSDIQSLHNLNYMKLLEYMPELLPASAIFM